MTKKFLTVLVTLALLISFTNVAIAENVPNQINADPVFFSITITLTTSKSALFSAYTYDIMDSISVASCWLQKKVNNSWTYVRSLPAPPDVITNTIGYGASMDYSSYIPSDGNTYRIAARFVADGHHATRYSNERSF